METTVLEVLHLVLILSIAVFGFLAHILVELHRKSKDKHHAMYVLFVIIFTLTVLIFAVGAEFFAAYIM